MAVENRVLNASGFVVGGLFLGAWLYFLLFAVPSVPVNTAPWLWWGLLGLAISAGLLGARLATVRIRMAIYVGLGIATGLLAMAAVFQRLPESMAAILTIAGGAMIVSSIPGGRNPDGTDPAANWPEPTMQVPAEPESEPEPFVLTRKRK